MPSGRVAFAQMDQVIFGQPAAQALGAEVERIGARRVFILSSGTLNRQTDEVARLRGALGDRHAATFDAIPAHTPRSAVVAATNLAREVRADVIVSIGGGSITDAAKAMQMALAEGVSTFEQFDALKPVPLPDGTAGPRSGRPITVRQVAIPTTLSAGEFSAISGVLNERTKVKELYRHPRIVPATVILDPAVTVHTPEWLWTSTGIRAVDHCVEGICSNEAHAFGDAQALRGLTLLAGGLPRVQKDPRDLDARLDCQMGAWLSMGPLATGVPMGASHGIGYVLGGMFDVPHGHTSCIMLPYVMRWNKVANAARQTLVAAALGDAHAEAGDLLHALIAGLGMPRRLAEYHIGSEHFAKMAHAALKTPWVPRNPRPIERPEQVIEILEMAA